MKADAKGVVLFKSNITKELYNEFLSSLHWDRSESSNFPFVYVDQYDKTVRLLTGLYESKGEESEIVAVSIAPEGELEFLSTDS